jgi:hypothetical protein
MGIENCRFKFRCEQTWDGLTQTPDPRVRHCSECREDVHFCTTDEQLAKAIRQGHCVAIPDQVPGPDEADDPEDSRDHWHVTVGVPAPPWDEDDER